jgi:hypothetical protein
MTGDRGRPRGGRTTPALVGALLLLPLLALVAAGVERTAPRPARSAPAVEGLPPTVLDAPVPCDRADAEAVIDAISAQLRPGRVTAGIVLACPRLFDGLEVVHVGEVVGDVLRRDGGAWVTLNDDAYALTLGPMGPHRERAGPNTGLTVWLPDGLHEDLGPPGRHGRRGDVLRVEGVLRRTDPADGGGLTVRATRAEVLASSVAIDEPVDGTLAAAAALSALAAAGATLHARRRRVG